MTLSKLKSWMKPEKVDTSMAGFPSRNRITYDPLGVVCIIGAWNYPVFTCFEPLVSAIAAGNVALIKPSEVSPSSSACLRRMIQEGMDTEFFKIVEGDHTIGKHLSTMRFDLIAFTGGSQIGKLVAVEAARNLVPCVLELGGINPCIIDETADVDFAAKKVTNGRFINAGQICISPD